MNPTRLPSRRDFLRVAVGASVIGPTLTSALAAEKKKKSGGERRLLYVAVPGIRNYLEFGGHGVIVFDIDNGHKFVRRIPAAGLNAQGKPENVKGTCASPATRRLYVSTLTAMTCFDLLTDKILWEKKYDGGCDRMALSPDGRVMYLPSLEKEHWHVVDALSGDVIKRLEPIPRAHNTVYGLDGKHAYLAGIGSPLLHVADTATHVITKKIGPFGSGIRPFTVNGKQTLCFVTVNGLLGFEIGDIKAGTKLHRVEIKGFPLGVPKRHGCPSHGVGLTPDEKEVWVCDAANQRMHIFDATVMPPKQIGSVEVREQPGWITFSLDGKFAYPSTGDVVDVATKKIVTSLTDENGGQVHSEKMVEIHFSGNTPVRTGDQFGVGRVI
jgi:DNA-binding beta-propeller fold protein YncE